MRDFICCPCCKTGYLVNKGEGEDYLQGENNVAVRLINKDFAYVCGNCFATFELDDTKEFGTKLCGSKIANQKNSEENQPGNN